MLEKRRSRISTKTSIGDEIAHLRGLDLKGLRSRWQSVFQRPPPDHLPRHLLFAIVTYRIQADRLGDLEQIPHNPSCIRRDQRSWRIRQV